MTKGPGPRNNPPTHPSPHAARDKTEEYDMRTKTGVERPFEPTLAQAAKIVSDHNTAMMKRGEMPDFDPPGIRAGYPDTPPDPPENPLTRGLRPPKKTTRPSPDWGGYEDGPSLRDMPSKVKVGWETPGKFVSEPQPVLYEEDGITQVSPEALGEGQDGGGQRLNAGKMRIELLPPEWIWALADVMSQGAKKYDPRNWELGMGWGSMIGCILRHVLKFMAGERYDGAGYDKAKGTTGCHHLAMAAWNCLALMSYDLRKIGENDLADEVDMDLLNAVNAATAKIEKGMKK